MEGTEQDKRGTTNKEEKLDLSNLQDFNFGTNWTESDPNSISTGSESTSSGRGKPSWKDGAFQAKRRDRRPPERSAQRPADGSRAGEDGGRGRPPQYSSRSQRHPGAIDFEPTVDVVFLAEETGFMAMCRAMRQSCRTYELFEIARLILAKPERFTISVQKRPNGEGKAAPLFLSVPDEHPFETEEEAIAHVLSRHSRLFFEEEAVEREALHGNFQFVNRCSFTGEILGAPNHHLYSQTIINHHAARLPTIPFERFKNSIETVKDPEVIGAWLENMKKGTRYVFPKEEGAEGEERPAFDSLEEARAYLLQNYRNRVVRTVKTAHLPGKKLDELASCSLRRSVEWMLEKQRRFPLDTSNVLRGRLRRQKFQIYKKGAHGISYVSSVRRKFRQPGQVFSESIQKLIQIIDENPMISASELPKVCLGIDPVSIEGEGGEVAASEPKQEDPRLKKLLVDLRWLLTEGYVTEFSDGRLSAPSPMDEAHDSTRRKANGEEAGKANEEPGTTEGSQAAAQSSSSAAETPASNEEGNASDAEVAVSKDADTSEDVVSSEEVAVSEPESGDVEEASAPVKAESESPAPGTEEDAQQPDAAVSNEPQRTR